MNLVSVAPLWLILLLCAAMAAAAIEDAVRYRISNITTIAVLVGAIVAALIAGPSWGLWQNAAIFAAILLVGTVLFSAGWLGGGDVKLFAAAGLWFDLRSAVWFVALVLISGGVVALGYLLSRPLRKQFRGTKNSRIPYGIAIALGAFALVVTSSGIFGHHARTLPARFTTIPH